MSVAPAGYTTAAPWIVTRDTRKLFEFITEVFDGVELGQVPLEDGSIGHAEIRVGDTVLLAFDHREGWPDQPSLLRAPTRRCADSRSRRPPKRCERHRRPSIAS